MAEPKAPFAAALVPALALHVAVMAVMPDLKIKEEEEEEVRVEITLEEPPEVEEPPPPPEEPPPPPPPAPQQQPDPEPEPEPEPAPEPEPVEIEETAPEPAPIEAPPAPKVSPPSGVSGGVVGGRIGGVIGGKVQEPPPPPPEPPSPPEQIQVKAEVQESRLLFRDQPEYPREAKKFRIQGTVKLEAVIGKQGQVKSIEVIDGHPLLTPTAVESVKKWRYKPTILQGKPVEVATQIHVRFGLKFK